MNDNKINDNNKKKSTFKIPSPDELQMEIDNDPIVKMAHIGSVWSVRLGELAKQITETIALMGLPEIVEIFFDPDLDTRANQLTPNTTCYAIFDTRAGVDGTRNIYIPGTDITTQGSVRMAVDVNGHSGYGGRYATSSTFKKVMATFAKDSSLIEDQSINEYDDNGKRLLNIKVNEYPSKPTVATVELDPQKVFQLALNVDSDYMNFSVIKAYPDRNDIMLMLLKYVDTSNVNRYSRNRNNINMNDVRASLARNSQRRNNPNPGGGYRNQNNGGGYQNPRGGRRSF